MKFLKLFPATLLLVTLCITGCAPKDETIKASIEEKLKAKQETAATMVTVDKGVATLTGQASSESAKAESEAAAKSVEHVKSVVNNIEVVLPTPPPPPVSPVTITADDPLTKSVADAVKDNPTVQATVEDGVITLTGTIEKSSLQRLMMKLNSLKPKKIINNLTVK